MARSFVILVSSDPRTSDRPAEAIRIAAGVGAWKTVEVTLYLRGPAVLALSESPEELVDGDHFAQYLPILGESSRPIYVQKGNPFLKALGQPALDFEELADPDLAELMAKCDCAARF